MSEYELKTRAEELAEIYDAAHKELREKLATAERERDEARAERDAWANAIRSVAPGAIPTPEAACHAIAELWKKHQKLRSTIAATEARLAAAEKVVDLARIYVSEKDTTGGSSTDALRRMLRLHDKQERDALRAHDAQDSSGSGAAFGPKVQNDEVSKTPGSAALSEPASGNQPVERSVGETPEPAGDYVTRAELARICDSVVTYRPASDRIGDRSPPLEIRPFAPLAAALRKGGRDG